jgi:hypothetical protein
MRGRLSGYPVSQAEALDHSELPAGAEPVYESSDAVAHVETVGSHGLNHTIASLYSPVKACDMARVVDSPHSLGLLYKPVEQHIHVLT